MVVATGGEHREQRVDPVSGATVEVFAVRGNESLLHRVSGDVRGYADFLIRGAFDALLLNGWQTWSTDVPLRMLDAIRGRKIVYSHGLSTELFVDYQPLRSILRWLVWRPYRWRLPARMRCLDGIVFLAEDGCDCRFADARLVQKLGVRSWVIPNAAPAAARAETSAMPRAARSYLLAVGAFDRLKGHDFVLRAYASSEFRNRLPLRFVGQVFTPETERLRALATELGVAPSVSFVEGLSGEALFDVYERAVLILNGSHTECQPLVLLDAMATGTPFVARATGCIPMLVGGHAVRSQAEMAKEIDVLAADEAAWARLSAAGVQAVRESYRQQIMGDALAAVLREVN